MNDAVSFANRDWISCDVLSRCDAFLGDVDTQHMSHEMHGDGDNLSSNTIIVKVTGDGDERNAVDIWSDYTIAVPTEED